MTEQFQLCEWRHFLLGKMHHSSEITSGSWNAPDYPKCPSTPLQYSAMKGNNGTKRIQYHVITAQTIIYPPPAFHSWNQAFRIISVLGSSPNENSSSCRKQREGRLILTISRARFQLSDVQVLWS
jgi:hypothetical protein